MQCISSKSDILRDLSSYPFVTAMGGEKMSDACKAGEGEVIQTCLSYCCNKRKVWHCAGYKFPRPQLQYERRRSFFFFFLNLLSGKLHARMEWVLSKQIMLRDSLTCGGFIKQIFLTVAFLLPKWHSVCTAVFAQYVFFLSVCSFMWSSLTELWWELRNKRKLYCHSVPSQSEH